MSQRPASEPAPSTTLGCSTTVPELTMVVGERTGLEALSAGGLDRVVRSLEMKLVASVFVVLGLASLGACGGESKIGEECDEAGQTNDVCESGGVCGKNTTGSLVCLKQCTEQTDCAANEECNGVEGSSLKGCRSKSGASGGKK